MSAKVRVTVEREYAMNVEKIRRDFAKEIAADEAAGRDMDAILRETFYELCGFERDRDHIDGSYVWLLDESGDTEWDFAAAVSGGS